MNACREFKQQKIAAKCQEKVLNGGGHKEKRDKLETKKNHSCSSLFRFEDVDSDHFEHLDGDLKC